MTALHEGDVAVVTGAGSGIGLAMSEAFAERGLTVVVADVDEAAISTTADTLRTYGVQVLASPLDVSDGRSMLTFAEKVYDTFGRCDVLCNNAGVFLQTQPAWMHTPDVWRRVLEVNAIGVGNGIAAFVPRMITAGTGHVVNTASMAGLMTVPGSAPYVASKHAVVAMSETLVADLELAEVDIGVTTVCPSLINTPMAAYMMAGLTASTPSRPPTPTPKATTSFPESMESADLARLIIRAVEANCRYVLSHPASWDRMEPRIRRLEDEVRTGIDLLTEPTAD